MHNEIELNDFCGLKSIDVVGLLYGKKKIISTSFAPERRRELEAAFVKYDLKWGVVDGFDHRGQSGTCIIAQKKKHLQAALEAYSLGRFDIVGALLGYPECCVKAHYAKISRRDCACDDFVRRCAVRSRSFLWPVNNVLDFDGRLLGKKAASFNISCPFVSLISHNPCSYGCKESLKIAIFNQARLAELSAGRRFDDPSATLAMPVLYVDDFNLTVLDGKSCTSSANYRGVVFMLGLEAVREKLNAGDNLEISGRSLTIYKQGKKIGSWHFNAVPLILPFDTGDFASERRRS